MHLRTGVIAVVLSAALGGFAAEARAHCDTWNGPVVASAREALRAGDVTPALKWIREAEETELRAAFAQALQVRGAGGAAQDLADRFFFETLVRLHRFGEGEPYTGLKDDRTVDPAVAEADTALEKGDAGPFVAAVTARLTQELRDRVAQVRALRAHADDSVADGRLYVAAYVEFIRFVETIQATNAHDTK